MITFTKMHGLSNDFVVLDGPVDLAAVLVRRLCDRRTGVGADGVLAVSASDGAEDVRMQYWNADGSTSEMCGNGLRCVATYARDRGLVAGERFVVDTPAGPKAVVMHARDDVSVDLGPVVVDPENLTLRARSWTRVRVGNPHVVTYVDDPAAAPVVSEGPLIETDPVFAAGTNVEYISTNGNTITMRVWERGVGETRACGSGMVAAAAAARFKDPQRDEWNVDVPGGTGNVVFEGDHVWLRGPTETVFTGEWSVAP